MSDKLTFRVTCFGAGQEVGRSSILVEMSGFRILLDCGINIGTTDEKERLPKLPPDPLNLDLVIVSHIHSDHLAALPYLTEIRQCKCPIYMTKVSKDLAGIMLKDFIKVTDNPPYQAQNIIECLKKVQTIDFYQEKEVIPDLFLTVYPAGHILGAGAFYFSALGRSFLYTGDFSGTADHHLSGHQIPRIYPDLLITESTYGNKVREPMYRRERSFVQMVHKCISQGGKVLIPVFAVGRLQEICLMLNDYWERMNINVPIYYSSKMGGQATTVYTQSIHWMNPTVKSNFYDMGQIMLNFTKVSEQKNSKEPIDGPCVMVATAGMLSTGASFEYFVKHKWCEDPKNLIIFPGYCGPGTLGNLVLTQCLPAADSDPNAHSNSAVIDFTFQKQQYNIQVNCQVKKVSFSAHADQFEILTMIKRASPRNVICLHGDPDSTEELSNRIKIECKNTKVEAPKNNKPVILPEVNVGIAQIAQNCIQYYAGQPFSFSGIITEKTNSKIKIVSADAAAKRAGRTLKPVIINRRIKISGTNFFARIITVLKNMGLVKDENELRQGDEIILNEMKISYTPEYILISFSPNQRLIANKFSALISS